MKLHVAFPEAIRRLREEAGISERELTGLLTRHGLDRSTSTMNRVYRGAEPVLPHHMEAIAAALGVEPETFAEYRLWQARRRFEPDEVGIDQAMRNLDKAEEESG
jgi:transcriptional regulator with XRE-family HTH domain